MRSGKLPPSRGQITQSFVSAKERRLGEPCCFMSAKTASRFKYVAIQLDGGLCGFFGEVLRLLNFPANTHGSGFDGQRHE